MRTSLYLVEYEKEIIKNEVFYKLSFFDNINGLVFKTHIHELPLKNDYLKLIDNGTPVIIDNLKKDLEMV